jgi:hypothetical protein
MRSDYKFETDPERERRIKREMRAAWEAKRLTRVEVWREEPYAADRPYRRKTDRRTVPAYHAVPNEHRGFPATWLWVLSLVKRGQRMRIRYVGCAHRHHRWQGPAPRMVRVHIENRKPRTR